MKNILIVAKHGLGDNFWAIFGGHWAVFGKKHRVTLICA
jgi:hypothetical protein